MSVRQHKAARFTRIRTPHLQCFQTMRMSSSQISRGTSFPILISFTCSWPYALCTCTTARSKQASAAGSAASKETTSRRCASAGCSRCTYWHHQEIVRENKSYNQNLLFAIYLQQRGLRQLWFQALAARCTSCKSLSTLCALAQHTCPSSCRFRPLVRSEFPRAWQRQTLTSHITSFTSPYLSAKHRFARIVLLVDLDHTLFVCLICVRFKGKSASSWWTR